MSLVELLATDLLNGLTDQPDGVDRRVLLWLDPEAQFSRLAPYVELTLLARGTQLLHCAGESGMSQLDLKLALLRLDAGADERAVVYLPGFDRASLDPRADAIAPELWSVYEYRYKGAIWSLSRTRESGELPRLPTLLAWLRRHGLQVADDKTARELTWGGRDSLLARFAERSYREPPDRWPRPLRVSDVLEGLAGDPREALRRLLVAPKNEVGRWADERALVLGRIRDEYGLSKRQLDPGEAPGKKPSKAAESRSQYAAPSDEELDAEALADAVVVQLGLTEAWDAFGRPDGFPFLSRLPATEEHRRRTIRFLRDDVLGHTTLGPSYLARMARLEPGYNLAAWASDRPGQPAGLPLLARSRWQRFRDRFDAAADADWRQARDLLLGERETVRAGTGASWDRLDGETFWFVLADLADLIERANASVQESTSLGQPSAMVAAYAEKWWPIDRLHLSIRAACARQAGLERVRRVADTAYFEYVATLSQRFSDLIEAGKVWPPVGCRDVGTLRSVLWTTSGSRQAVIVSDACRWDLARVLSDRLTYDCELTPVLTTLPTTTPFGMTALLPLDEAPLTVDFRAHDVLIKQGESQNLAARDGRKAFLQTQLVGRDGSTRVDFVDMDDLLRGCKIPTTLLVVVFDNTIDEQGHKGTEELPGLAEPFVGNLKRTIDRLHEAGIAAVHLVTDHGFLLLPPEAVDDLGRPVALPNQVLEKDERWAAIKPGAPVNDLYLLPLPLAPDITLGFARGVRTLVKAPGFVHGGISLQECVVPHLVSRMSLPQARVALDLRVSTDRLSVGTVPVILRPSIGQAQAPLGGLQPIVVRLWVETTPSDGGPPRRVTDTTEIELRPDVDELKPPVYLREGLELKAGQALLLRALDAENGEDLGSVPLTLLVDWD